MTTHGIPGSSRPEIDHPETREVERLLRLYSERRGREVLVRIRYAVEPVRGCQIVSLRQVDELE